MPHDPNCWCRQFVSFVGENDNEEQTANEQNVSRETIRPFVLDLPAIDLNSVVDLSNSGDLDKSYEQSNG